MEKDRMHNFSFVLYGKRVTVTLNLKRIKKLTHGEAIKLLLDVYKSVEKQRERGGLINGLFAFNYLIFNPSSFMATRIVATDYVRGRIK